MQRIQCNGDPDPQNVNWPNLATNALPATITDLALTPTTGSANACTAAETVAQNVQSVEFTYFAGTASTSTKSAVTRIDFNIKLRKVYQSMNVDHDVVGAVSLRN